jgi:excisionase family DNA binding protein
MRIKIDHDQKALLTFVDVARTLGVTTETLKRAAARGQIRTVELNRRVLIPRAEVARLSGGALK